MPIDPRRIEVIDDKTAEILRGMSPTQRLRSASELHEMALVVIRAGVKYAHPTWDEAAVRKEILRRVAGA
jgi:hypothetical protein